MDRPPVDPLFGEMLRQLRIERGLSLRGLGGQAHRAKSHLHDLETGRKAPTAQVAADLDRVLNAGGRLAELGPSAPVASDADETAAEAAAAELKQRIEASDVSAGTLDRLEAVADEQAVAYPSTHPAVLLARVRRHVTAVGPLFDARMTLRQRQRLTVAAGWLSLLAATLQIDLRARSAARATLDTASAMADQSGHAELRAWCVETRAWAVLIVGEHRRALELSRQAQAMAPRGSSAYIQSTAQEGRAWARLGERGRTRDVLDRLEKLTSSLAVPDRPEHHYRYDPSKALSYTATTLAWAGDPAAELYARALVADLDGGPRKRRAELARLDLALALLMADKPDEAAATAAAAIESGWLVPSTWWRATEVLAGVEAVGIREARDLRDVYEAHRPIA
jgi:transcriptional regulator with XRE-family HTH domain